MKKIIFLVLLTILISCSKSSENEISVASSGAADIALESPNTGPLNSIKSIERKIIREGSMSVEVKNLSRSDGYFKSIIKQCKAYTTNETSDTYTGNKSRYLTIRVPLNSFDTLVAMIESYSVQLLSKSITTSDVTDEFVDVDARLKTKKNLESRYLDLLKQAKNVTEILAIEKELAAVRSEIESMTSRQNYISSQSDYATLNLTYTVATGTFSDIGQRIGRGLGFGLKGAVEFFIMALKAWPLVILFTLILWLGKRRKRT